MGEPPLDEVLPEALAGERLDRVVALLGDLSRARAGELVDAGSVLVDGRPVTQRSHRVQAGDRVTVTEPLEAGEDLPSPDPSVEVVVVHEDPHLVVVDKPAGLVVHPGAGHAASTLVHGLLARYPEMAGAGDPARPGIVHRLDRGTSGLLLVARTREAYEALVAALAAREVSRRYLALVWGVPASRRGMVDAPVGRSRRDPTRMAVVKDGKEARTEYHVRAEFERPARLALLECRLHTGRTHQIRVHLSAIGHPVVGDDRYGGVREALRVPRPFLHAAELELDHPVTGERLRFTSPLPEDLERVLSSLG